MNHVTIPVPPVSDQKFAKPAKTEKFLINSITTNVLIIVEKDSSREITKNVPDVKKPAKLAPTKKLVILVGMTSLSHKKNNVP